ncbi:MAG: UAA transporter [Geoglossum umbratile]|nr:MAG: UAA transporter [Geoglossum umbratile]
MLPLVNDNDDDNAEKTQLLASTTSPGTPRSQIIGTIPGDATPAPLVGLVDGSAAVSTRVKLCYLAVYFAVNLGLTVYNKVVMGKFPFPYLLTGLHTASGCLGCWVLLLHGTFTLTRLAYYDKAVLVAFSFLYTLNIAISNVSLNLVTIPFHQIVRATTPIATILIYRFVYSKTYSTLTYLSLIPTIIGVALATYGDYHFTPLGFLFTLLGAILAALKTVTTNRMQTGRLNLSALEILYRMSPLALIQAITYAYLSGEVDTLRRYALEGKFSGVEILGLLINTLLAFSLNIVSFTANKKTGGLTMSVAANLKQILTIVLGVLFFRLKVGPLNAFGIILTLLGSAWYGKVELDSKDRTPKLPKSPPPPPYIPTLDTKAERHVWKLV